MRFYNRSLIKRVVRNSTKMTVLHRLILKLEGVLDRCLEFFNASLFLVLFFAKTSEVSVLGCFQKNSDNILALRKS